jgi:membrane dipeptidase
MLLIDSHLDLSWNALGWNRDLRLSIAEIRAAEAGMMERGRQTNTVSFPEMRRAEIGICIATLLARCHPVGRTLNLDFRTREIASSVAQGQLAYYRVLEADGVCRQVRDLKGLKQSFSEWRSGTSDAPFGFIISMEGADPILSPSDVAGWWEDGLRAIGPAHYGPSAYAHGTGCSGGLMAKGPDFLRAMEECGMILDLTHLADESFWQALDIFHGPVLASHNNCRALVPGDRQYSDDQVRAIIARDGVIGAVFDAWMLVPDWKITTPNTATIESAVDQMDHICQLAGNARHIAIGSDLDGGYGTEQTPTDLDTIADLQKIPAILRRRGYSEADIEGVFHGNWMRFFEKAWAKN